MKTIQKWCLSMFAVFAMMFMFFGAGTTVGVKAEGVPVEQIKVTDVVNKAGESVVDKYSVVDGDVMFLSGLTLIEDDERTLTAKVFPEGADANVKWTVSDSEAIEIVGADDELNVKIKALKKTSVSQIKCTSQSNPQISKSLNIVINLPYSEVYETKIVYNNIMGELQGTAVTLDMEKMINSLRNQFDALTSEEKALADMQDCLALIENAEKELSALKLQDYKESVKEVFDAYKDFNLYREAQKAELNKIIADAKKAMEEADSKESIDRIISDAKKAMDAVKTDAQLKAEEAAKQQETVAPTVNLAKTKVKAKAKGKSVKLTWKKVKKANGYKIYRATSKKGTFKRVKTVSKKKLSFTDKKVKKNKKYFYKVCAYKTVNGKKVSGKFSKVIAVKVK